MKNLLIVLGAVLLLAVLAAAAYILILSGQGSYQPGRLAESQELDSPLIPPEQAGDPEFWQVAPDIQLYHFSHGSGTPVLVIHGGPGYPFREPISALQELDSSYSFHYFDQRGCGRSSRPINRFESRNYYQNTRELESRLGISAQLADIERIRQLLGQDQLVIIGHSYGSFLASLYAVEFPDRTAGLVLSAPANVLMMPQEDQDSDLFNSIASQLPPAELADFEKLMEDYFDFKNLFQKSEADLVALQEALGRYYLLAGGHGQAPIQGEPGGWMVWAMYLSTGQRYDYRPYLEQVEVPVLVLHGEKDLQSEAASRSYADAFPSAEFVTIPGAGHFIFQDQPDEYSSLVASFLSSLP